MGVVWFFLWVVTRARVGGGCGYDAGSGGGSGRRSREVRQGRQAGRCAGLDFCLGRTLASGELAYW
jgi:hypothetical protein